MCAGISEGIKTLQLMTGMEENYTIISGINIVIFVGK